MLVGGRITRVGILQFKVGVSDCKSRRGLGASDGDRWYKRVVWLALGLPDLKILRGGFGWRD